MSVQATTESTTGWSFRYRRHVAMSAALLLVAFCRLPALAQDKTTLQYPVSLAVSSEGKLFVADRNLPGVWSIEDQTLKVHFQGQRKFRTPLNAVRCVAIDADGKLLAGDSSTREVFRFEDGVPKPLTSGAIGIPWDLAITKAGDIVVSDLDLHCVWKVPKAGGEPQKLADIRGPRGLAIDDQDRVWVLNAGKDQIVRLLPDGKQETVVSGKPFQFALDLVLDDAGQAYVSDNFSHCIWKVDAEGKTSKWVDGKPLINPAGMAWHDKHLWVADSRVPAVFQFAADGKLVSQIPAAP